MIVTVTLNPAVDHTLFIEGLKPHDTNRVVRVERDAGGKGINAARVISGLCGKTMATGFLGGSTGAYVRHVLASEGVCHHFSQVSGETRINFSVEDGSGLPPTCFNEPGPAPSESEMQDLMTILAVRLHPGDWLLVAGSLPPMTPPLTYLRLGQIARERGALLALDADGEALRIGIQAGPFFLKPNVKEAERLLGRGLNTQDELLAAAAEIRNLAMAGHQSSRSIVVISRGADGAVMADEGGTWIGETPHVQTQSTVGSGDSMVGAFLFALEDGRTHSEALALGMAAGAATAADPGSGLAARDSIERLLPLCRVAHVGVG